MEDVSFTLKKRKEDGKVPTYLGDLKNVSER